MKKFLEGKVISVKRFIILATCAALYMASVSVYGGEVKYVFLMIGDGMGINQRKAAEICLKATGNEKKKRLVMDSFPVSSLTKTNSLSGITDSAASGTALACGEKTKNKMLGILPDGRKIESLSEKAVKAGMKTAIITNAPVNHATPAAFYAHTAVRNDYSKITSFIPSSGIDILIGANFMLTKGYRAPDSFLSENGYTIIKDAANFRSLKKGCSKIIFLDKNSYVIDYHKPTKSRMTLSERLAKSIELLDNPNGFFIVLEGAKIDWTCHANDIAATVKQVLVFDDAVKTAYEFYLKHKDNTLIVVTADHECGGLMLTQDGNLSEMVSLQKCSRGAFAGYLNACKKNNTPFDKVLIKIKEQFGLKDIQPSDIEKIRMAYDYFISNKSTDVRPEEIQKMYGRKNPVIYVCGKIFDKKAGVQWGSRGHTNAKVKTTAIGKYAEDFRGEMDNTEIFDHIKQTLGLN